MSKPLRGFFRMGLNVAMPWPSMETTIQFRGRELTLCPETDRLAPSVFVNTDEQFGQDDARRLIQEFLSSLAWIRGGGASETFSTWCSAAPIGVGKSRGRTVSDAPIEYLPDPTDELPRRALAIYREACAVNVIPYQFLGFYKIVEIRYRNMRDQIAWVNKVAVNLTGHLAIERVQEIRNNGGDLGDYLYKDGRCAVAHAHDQNVVNPDDPIHMRRLAEDLPIVRALAEYLVEVELGVKSLRAILDEHLYELEGFAKRFGPDVTAELKARRHVDASRLTLPARLSLRLQGRPQLKTFTAMQAALMSSRNGVLIIRCRSTDSRTTLSVQLDFPEERFRCNASLDLVVVDDESTDAAAAKLDELDFFQAWMSNGVVEAYDAATGERLGRSKPVFEELTNMLPNWDVLDSQRQSLLRRLGRPLAQAAGPTP